MDRTCLACSIFSAAVSLAPRLNDATRNEHRRTEGARRTFWIVHHGIFNGVRPEFRRIWIVRRCLYFDGWNGQVVDRRDSTALLIQKNLSLSLSLVLAAPYCVG